MLRILILFLALNFFSNSSWAQEIEIPKFNADLTYVQGEHIGLITNTKGIFPIDNTFTLELSDALGSFSNPTTIVTISSFFQPVFNGTIPEGTPPGNGYRLRVRGDDDIIALPQNLLK